MGIFIYVGIMAKSRYVKDSMRSDNRFTDLTVSEKLLFTYLLTNDKVGLCWVYELPLKKIQRETGIDSGTLWKAFERFESVWKVCYKNWRVMIVNFLKNQSMNDNMVKWAKREAENIGKEVWLSFADFKGFERLWKDFESFDILNLTLLNLTLPNLTTPNGEKEEKIIKLTTIRKEEMFTEFWKVYPNKQWKAKAEEWYIKNITEELHKQILKWVQAYKRTTEEKKSRKEFAPEYKHWSSYLNQRRWEDFTDITEEESFREAYEKWDAKIYSWWCKTEIGDSWSTNEEYYKPYNDLKSAILQKNNDRDWYDNFISCYQTKWKN